LGSACRRVGQLLAAVVPLVALGASAALASSEGEAGSHGAGFGMPMVYSIINFALLVIAFVYLYRKKASGTFEKRSLEVQMEMEEAAEAKRQADAKYQEYRKRLEQLDKEVGKILELAVDDAEQERRRILDEAHKQAEKMLKQAELTARHEVDEAKRQLRREAADLAAEMAAEIVKKAAGPEDQRSWVQTYIQKIGEMR
jgi:F-type H+-transporting ATPase subunit b